jgi:hypothetical protein
MLRFGAFTAHLPVPLASLSCLCRQHKPVPARARKSEVLSFKLARDHKEALRDGLISCVKRDTGSHAPQCGITHMNGEGAVEPERRERGRRGSGSYFA